MLDSERAIVTRRSGSVVFIDSLRQRLQRALGLL